MRNRLVKATIEDELSSPHERERRRRTFDSRRYGRRRLWYRRRRRPTVRLLGQYRYDGNPWIRSPNLHVCLIGRRGPFDEALLFRSTSETP
jgi:hypothetical protein